MYISYVFSSQHRFISKIETNNLMKYFETLEFFN